MGRCLTVSESATPGLAQYLARYQGQDESKLDVFCLCVEPGGDGSVKHPPDPQGEVLGSAPGGVQWGPNHSTSQPSPTITGADTVPVKPLTSDNDDHNHDHDTTSGDCYQVWGSFWRRVDLLRYNNQPNQGPQKRHSSISLSNYHS